MNFIDEILDSEFLKSVLKSGENEQTIKNLMIISLEESQNYFEYFVKSARVCSEVEISLSFSEIHSYAYANTRCYRVGLIDKITWINREGHICNIINEKTKLLNREKTKK